MSRAAGRVVVEQGTGFKEILPGDGQEYTMTSSRDGERINYESQLPDYGSIDSYKSPPLDYDQIWTIIEHIDNGLVNYEGELPEYDNGLDITTIDLSSEYSDADLPAYDAVEEIDFRKGLQRIAGLNPGLGKFVNDALVKLSPEKQQEAAARIEGARTGLIGKVVAFGGMDSSLTPKLTQGVLQEIKTEASQAHGATQKVSPRVERLTDKIKRVDNRDATDALSSDDSDPDLPAYDTLKDTGLHKGLQRIAGLNPGLGKLVNDALVELSPEKQQEAAARIEGARNGIIGKIIEFGGMDSSLAPKLTQGVLQEIKTEASQAHGATQKVSPRVEQLTNKIKRGEEKGLVELDGQSQSPQKKGHGANEGRVDQAKAAFKRFVKASTPQTSDQHHNRQRHL